MKKTLYVGVDGGGTKCTVRVEDEAGKVLGREIGGPANIRISASQAWESIYTALDKIIKKHDKQYSLQAGMGLAGCETQEARAAFLSQPHPFEKLILASDAHVACLGAHGGADGAIIGIGTGVVGYQIEAGRTTKISGWGFPHDDQGGGAWLGLEAVKLAFQSLDGRLPSTQLTQEIYAHFYNNLNDFVAWANAANSTAFAELAPIVINACQRGDVDARQLMQAAADAITRVYQALSVAQTKALPCALVGSIVPFLEAFLSSEVKARLVPSQATPDVGAIRLTRLSNMG
jgi:glucosamine kinase